MMISFSVSIDDGFPHDLVVAEQLLNIGVRATFYVPKFNREGRQVLNASEIRHIHNMGHFLGSHTYNHQYLSHVPLERAKKEIVSGHSFLEDVVGQKVASFCFPGGKFNPVLLNFTKDIGLQFVRSTRNFQLVNSSDFLVHTAFQIYPHNNFVVALNILKQLGFVDYRVVSLRSNFFSNSDLHLVDFSYNSNAHLHFWLHSWEIEDSNVDYLSFFRNLLVLGWINLPLELFIV